MENLLRRAYFSVQKRFFKTAQDRIFDKWFADHGDETYRLNYDHTAESIVVDCGGYKGDWAHDIFERYKSRVLVFEPVTHFADGIRARFKSNSKVETFTFGLGDANETAHINLSENASSQFARKFWPFGGASEPTVEIKIRKFAEFMDEAGITYVDLMKINIEGAEYDLLDHVIASDWAPRIRDIQVQFHDFVPNASERRERIRAVLRATHHTTYEYPFVWENWRRNNS